MLIHSSRTATNHMEGFLCFCIFVSRFAPNGDPANFNLWGERSTPEYLLPKRGFDTRTRVVSATESHFLNHFGTFWTISLHISIIFCNFAHKIA